MKEISVLLKKIGENVRKYRVSKDITQEELAQVCNLHRNYIISVEKGERNLSILTLEKISKGLNVSLNNLLE